MEFADRDMLIFGEYPYFYGCSHHYKGRSYFIFYFGRDLRAVYFNEVGRMTLLKTDKRPHHRGNYCTKIIGEIRDNPNNFWDIMKFYGLSESERFLSLARSVEQCPGDTLTLKALDDLERRGNKRVGYLLSQFHIIGNASVEDYNTLVEGGSVARAALDILERHPWVFSAHPSGIAKFFFSFLKQTDWDRHPDDVVLEYVNHVWEQNPAVGVIRDMRDGMNKKLNDFSFTKSGVASMEGTPGIPHGQSRLLLNYFSSLPPSWAHAFKGERNLVANANLAKLLNTGLIASQEDLVRLLKPFKGDLAVLRDAVLTWHNARSERENYFDLLRNRANPFGEDVDYADPDLPGRPPLPTFSRNLLASDGSNNDEIQRECPAFDAYFGHLEDFVKSVDERIIRPALALSSGVLGNFDFLRTRWLYRLLDFSTLHQLKKKDDLWHADDDLRASFGTEMLSWFPLSDDFVTANGLELKVLTTSRELVAEGSGRADENGVPGLSHCVGSYASRCAKGTTHIISVRERVGDSYRRLSTVEISTKEKKPAIKQHFGSKNSSPIKRAERAVAEYLAILGTRELPISSELGSLSPSANVDPDKLNAQLQFALISHKRYLGKRYQGISVENLIADIRDDVEALKHAIPEFAEAELIAIKEMADAAARRGRSRPVVSSSTGLLRTLKNRLFGIGRGRPVEV